MQVTRKSQFSGKYHTLDLPITSQELFDYEVGKNSGRLIQHVFPNLTASQREFLMTGITHEEWDELFEGSDE